MRTHSVSCRTFVYPTSLTLCHTRSRGLLLGMTMIPGLSKIFKNTRQALVSLPSKVLRRTKAISFNDDCLHKDLKSRVKIEGKLEREGFSCCLSQAPRQKDDRPQGFLDPEMSHPCLAALCLASSL